MNRLHYAGTRAGDTVHHLYPNGPDQDLVPFCGETPGRDPESGLWHTGHDRAELNLLSSMHELCCTYCLAEVSPEYEDSEDEDQDAEGDAQGSPG